MPWQAICTALLVSSAAGLLTLTINRAAAVYACAQTADADPTVTVGASAAPFTHPEPGDGAFITNHGKLIFGKLGVRR